MYVLLSTDTQKTAVHIEGKKMQINMVKINFIQHQFSPLSL